MVTFNLWVEHFCQRRTSARDGIWECACSEELGKTHCACAHHRPAHVWWHSERRCEKAKLPGGIYFPRCTQVSEAVGTRKCLSREFPWHHIWSWQHLIHYGVFFSTLEASYKYIDRGHAISMCVESISHVMAFHALF